VQSTNISTADLWYPIDVQKMKPSPRVARRYKDTHIFKAEHILTLKKIDGKTML